MTIINVISESFYNITEDRSKKFTDNLFQVDNFPLYRLFIHITIKTVNCFINKSRDKNENQNRRV